MFLLESSPSWTAPRIVSREYVILTGGTGRRTHKPRCLT
jgi:hypothetical protein